MERRKFILGVGSLAAGGAAAMGTGAVSSVTADRDVRIVPAADADAYLGLATPNNSVGYAPTNDVGSLTKQTGSSGVIKFSLNGNGTTPGEGVNGAALTEVFGLIGMQNQGTQELDVYVEKENTGAGANPDRVGVYVAKNTNTGKPGHIDANNEISGSGNAFSLGVGTNAVISLQIDTQSNGQSSSVTKHVAGGSFTDPGPITDQVNEMLEDLVFHADA
jgi:hypothetical protein